MERITGLPALLIHRRLTRAFAASLALVAVIIAPISSPGASAVQPRLAPCSVVANGIAGATIDGQLITVIALSTNSETATLNFYARQGGCLRLADGPYPAMLGRNGLSTHHHEGDNTTPIGLFGIQSTMYGVLPNPGVAYQYHR